MDYKESQQRFWTQIWGNRSCEEITCHQQSAAGRSGASIMRTILIFYCQLVIISIVVSIDCRLASEAEEASTFGSVVRQVAEAVGRSITTSSVLTVNLTNALILAGLKALVIIGGILGKFSFWSFPGLGGTPFPRSMGGQAPDEDALVSEIKTTWLSNEDVRWASTYMWALNKQHFGCLHRLACENPNSTRVYINAGNLLNDAFQLFDWLLPYDPKYKRILEELAAAEAVGRKSLSRCKSDYNCKAPFLNANFKPKVARPRPTPKPKPGGAV